MKRHSNRSPRRGSGHDPVARDGNGSGPPPATGPGPAYRWLLTAVGLALLALAAVANWSDDFLFAAHWKVYVRLPGMAAKEYVFFSVYYLLAALPLATGLLCLAFPRFRQALVAPWRRSGSAVPLVFALLFLGFTMLPWEFTTTRAWETGSRMVSYLALGGCGFALFMAGFHRRLAFLDRPVERLFDRLMSLPRRRFALLLFGFTFVLTNLLSWLVFEHVPHVQDSIAQHFQARIFASGRLFLDSPRFPGFFDYTHVINNGRWYSQYPFLHSLLMTPLVLIGAPWLLNPLLGALTVPAVYLLGREVYGERTGRLAGVLVAGSPFVFFMSSEFMNGASALLFATLFALLLLRTLRAARWRDALGAGLCIGLLACVRPYTAVAVAVPFAGYGLYRLVREPRRLVSRLAAAVAVGGAVAALALVYNRLTNGDWLTFGYVVKWGPGHEVGFGRSAWGAGHTPLRGLVNTGNSLSAVSKFLYEWPLAALVPVLVPFAAGTRRREDWLMAAWFLALVVAYFFYWFHNIVFGPRFVYEAVPALVLLTVRGGEELGPLLRRGFGQAVTGRAVNRFLGRALVVLAAAGLLAGIGPLVREYYRYADVGTQVRQNVRRAGLDNAVVFLHHFGNGFSANRLDLAGDVVYAQDFGLLNSALTLSYPGREYWYAHKDTLRRLEGIEFAGSRLERALAEMGAFLDDSLTLAYRAVVWPFIDLPVKGADGRPLAWPDGPVLTDYRLVSREIFTGRRKLDDYLPCLACWMVGDDREHLRIFSFMDDLQNFIAGEFKFTLLAVTAEGTGAVYDIRPATGEERMFPGRQ